MSHTPGAPADMESPTNYVGALTHLPRPRRHRFPGGGVHVSEGFGSLVKGYRPGRGWSDHCPGAVY